MEELKGILVSVRSLYLLTAEDDSLTIYRSILVFPSSETTQEKNDRQKQK